MFIKIKGPEISIATANTVDDATIVRVIASSTGVLNFAYANGTVYANTTVLATESLVVVKGETDTLAGTGMKGTPVEYRG